MNKWYENGQVHVSLPEIVAVFQDLALLSLHGHGRLPATEVSPSVASALLSRLLTLCHSSQGAIFLTVPSLATSESFSSSALDGKASRLFALHRVSKDEVQALLTSFSTESIWTSPPSDNPAWLHWRLPLTLSFPPEYQHSEEDQGQLDTIPSLQALLFFGWGGQDEEQRAAVMAAACAVLPLIADAVGMVIVRVLSIEYMNEFEARVDREALREMELLKAELLATVSHELRSPLASIKGYASTLLRHERRISREERREFLLAINAASDRLADVINSLLEISELETGTIEIERTPINVTHLVCEAVKMAEQRLKEAALVGVIEPSSEYPAFTLRLEDRHGNLATDEVFVEADQMRLREVLDQLLQNATIHASEDGVIEVVIRPVLSPDDLKQFPLSSHETLVNITDIQRRYNHVVVITVHDNGRGIPPEHLTRIFEPFYRVDTRLTRETGGLGLGLAICRRIVELHEGMLWGESEKGQGSTFYVCLPLHEPAQNQRTDQYV